MRISSKTRYALISMIYLAKQPKHTNTTLLQIANEFNISKIYLEQVFTPLKKANLVQSIKGPTGGYRLAKESNEISLYDLIFLFETSWMEPTESTTTIPSYEQVLHQLIWTPLDEVIQNQLKSITLDQLVHQIDLLNQDHLMFYI